MSMTMPTIRVGNVCVANFSSPHPFHLDNGQVLPACDPDRSRALMLKAQEEETLNMSGGWVDIQLRFGMSEEVYDALWRACAAADLVIVPLPVRQAIRETFSKESLVWRKTRTCRVKDRVTKTIYHDRFCL